MVLDGEMVPEGVEVRRLGLWNLGNYLGIGLSWKGLHFLGGTCVRTTSRMLGALSPLLYKR